MKMNIKCCNNITPLLYWSLAIIVIAAASTSAIYGQYAHAEPPPYKLESVILQDNQYIPRHISHTFFDFTGDGIDDFLHARDRTPWIWKINEDGTGENVKISMLPNIRNKITALTAIGDADFRGSTDMLIGHGGYMEVWYMDGIRVADKWVIESVYGAGEGFAESIAFLNASETKPGSGPTYVAISDDSAVHIVKFFFYKDGSPDRDWVRIVATIPGAPADMLANIGDVDMDGYDDLASVFTENNTVHVMLSGSGFEKRYNIPISEPVSAIGTMRDVNFDGTSDLAVAAPDGIRVLYMSPDGTAPKYDAWFELGFSSPCISLHPFGEEGVMWCHTSGNKRYAIHLVDPAYIPVPAGSSFIPEGMGDGDSFRLLFSTAKSVDNALEWLTFDKIIQDAARTQGLPAPTYWRTLVHVEDESYYASAPSPYYNYKSFLDMLRHPDTDLPDFDIPTESTNERLNTHYEYTGQGPPVYWLGGDRIAPDYWNFYHEQWESYVMHDETGAKKTDLQEGNVWHFTGMHKDNPDYSIGRVIHVRDTVISSGTVGCAGPNSILLGERTCPTKKNVSLYGLSPVFVVNAQQYGMPVISIETEHESVAEGGIITATITRPASITGDFDIVVNVKSAHIYNSKLYGDTITMDERGYRTITTTDYETAISIPTNTDNIPLAYNPVNITIVDQETYDVATGAGSLSIDVENDDQQSLIFTVGDTEYPAGTDVIHLPPITEGTVQNATFSIHLASEIPFIPGKNYYQTTTVMSHFEIPFSDSVKKTKNEHGTLVTDPDWELYYVTTDADRIICHVGLHKPGEAIATNSRWFETPYGVSQQDLKSGCPSHPIRFDNSNYHAAQTLIFGAGHDPDAMDHVVDIYVTTSPLYGGTYNLKLPIIDDDKNKTVEEAKAEYRILKYHGPETAQATIDGEYSDTGKRPPHILLTHISNDSATIWWDNSEYTHLILMNQDTLQITDVYDAESPFVLTNLTRNSEYNVIVCKNVYGCDPQLGDIKFNTLKHGQKPLGLHALAVSEITNTSITAKWDKVRNADSYLIKVWPVEIPPLYISHSVDGQAQTVSGLDPGTEYAIQVFARELIGDAWHVYEDIASPVIVAKTSGNASNTAATAGDTTRPVITLNGSDPVVLEHGALYTEYNATCIDETDGALQVMIQGVVDTQTAGDYEILYSCVDATGNIAATTRTIVVKQQEMQTSQAEQNLQTE